MAMTQRIVTDEATTWTVVSQSFSIVEPVEAYLEYGRQVGFSPNTIKAYARGLAQWWTYLETVGKHWDAVQIHDFGCFLSAVRNADLNLVSEQQKTAVAVAESTVQQRLRAVMSFYRYQTGCGNDVAPFLYERGRGRSSRYVSFLQHTARPDTQRRATIRVRVRPKRVPILAPPLIDQMTEAEARFDPVDSEWQGDLRYRLLWTLLAETGMRIGEALSLQHGDWSTGRSSTASVHIVDRPHPHRVMCKSGDRQIHIGSRLDRLYGDYIWWLCDRGADAVIDDWDSSYIFCNIYGGKPYAALRPEAVYAHLRVLKRRLPQLDSMMTPHWFRHTHATALLLSGTPLHVVSRRLGHRSVQTTLDVYGHVTEDAELEALANWREFVAGWETQKNE